MDVNFKKIICILLKVLLIYCSISCLLSIVFFNLEVFFILKFSNVGLGFFLKIRITLVGNDIIIFFVIFIIYLKL